MAKQADNETATTRAESPQTARCGRAAAYGNDRARERGAGPWGTGTQGKLLFVDLTTKTITEESPDEAFYRSIIGGTGLGAKVLMERMKPGADPLGPDNMLGFVTGPLTATGVYGGGRFMVTTKSPLTGGWADSNSGGNLGPELKNAGYDGVFFTGVAERRSAW